MFILAGIFKTYVVHVPGNCSINTFEHPPTPLRHAKGLCRLLVEPNKASSAAFFNCNYKRPKRSMMASC